KHDDVVRIEMESIRGRQIIQIKYGSKHTYRLALLQHLVQLQHRRPGSRKLLAFYLDSNPFCKSPENEAWPDAIGSYRYSIQPDKREIGKKQTRADSKNHGFVKLQTMKAQYVRYNTALAVRRLFMCKFNFHDVVSASPY